MAIANHNDIGSLAGNLVSYAGSKRGQLDAILRYAANNQNFPVAAFVALTKGKNSKSISIARQVIKQAAVDRHATAVVVSLQRVNRFKR